MSARICIQGVNKFAVVEVIQSYFVEPNTLFIFFNDEVHINARKEITYNVFSQNRLLFGVGYQFTKGLNVQVAI